MCLLIGLGVWDKFDRGNAEKIVIPAKAGIQGFDFIGFCCCGEEGLISQRLGCGGENRGNCGMQGWCLFFLGCCLPQGMRWCFNPSYIKLRCLWVVVRRPKCCWAAASCLGGEVGEVDDTMRICLMACCVRTVGCRDFLTYATVV